MDNVENAVTRLTSFSHGGGCGCKLSPKVLEELLRDTFISKAYPNLLVGAGTADDAAVYRINDHQAIVATTDFFLPIVDNPYDFGRIAATNAISDVYAMGGTPIFALALVGMPLGKLPVQAMAQILAGGQSICESIGIPIAGGHSIDIAEPIYGLVVLGLVDPSRIKRNDSARSGDVLILGKPLGVGILSAALKKEELSADGYAEMLETTTQLNTAGVALGQMDGVHAMTDVTGFALLGHLLEVCRGSHLSAKIRFDDLPILPTALALAKQGYATGASDRNWAGYGHEVKLAGDTQDWKQKLLCDPQTSGGLLVSCDAATAPAVLELFKSQGYTQACVIGSMSEGPAIVEVQ